MWDVVSMIGKQIQTWRKKKGLSLSELAERAGIAKSYLSSLERDVKQNPSIQIVEKIAQVLHVPVQLLLNDQIDLDEEWIELASEAIKSGISKEDFRQFLEHKKNNH